ncbi:hypothetical protein [Actinacidiphila glaucinigra]|uniref:hypothetical protein n=1 Tax=Actinacidiphila glaucinigra TaxID=235986 RepID=UPI00366D8DAC
MVQNLVAVFSLLIGLAGLTLSYMAHRQTVRQDEQESARRAADVREAREEEQEQEHSFHERATRELRERQRYQASLISVLVAVPRSCLHGGWAVPRVVLENCSSQPVRDVWVSYRGEVIGTVPLLGTGEEFFPLPLTQLAGERSGQLGEVTVDFTDVSGIRWRREGYGALRRAREEIGESGGGWEDPETPHIERVTSSPPMPAPARGPLPPEASAQRPGQLLRPVVILVSVVLVAGGVWWLLSH